MRARDRRRPRLYPLALERHVQPRAADAAHVRRDAAARHRRLHLADRAPLGELGRRLGSRLPRRALGSHRRRGGRAPLPRHHELEPGSGDPRALVGLRRCLGRRARDLGRDPVRRPRRRHRRAALGQQHPADDGRGRARAPARAGNRPLGQLLEPGALRQADEPALGAAHRSRRTRPGSRTVPLHRRSSATTSRPSSTSSSGT